MSAKQRKASTKKAQERVGYYRLPEGEFERLRNLASEEERPVSDLARRAIREFLSRTNAA